MAYRVGTYLEASELAERLNETDVDGGYSACVYDWTQDEPRQEGIDLRTLNIWGVIHKSAFIWNAKSLANWRSDHPIVARAHSLEEFIDS